MALQVVIKLDPATMGEIARWEGVTGSVLSVNGKDALVAALNTPDVVLIDPATMTESGRWTGAAGEIPEKLARMAGAT